jgi:ketosteroid isomerase-like protein
MSQNRVDLVRRIHEHLGRQDWSTELITDDIEYVNPPYAVEPGVRYGRDSFKGVRETYEDFSFRIDEVVDSGGGDVVVLGEYTASGRASRVPVRGEHGYVWTIRDGQAVRFQWFQSHAEALEAAGVGKS